MHPYTTTSPTNHPVDPTEESLRWLSIADKLLQSRDLLGSKSFATRAKESDPTLQPAPHQIIAIADTLLAADDDHGDWYGILQLDRRTNDMDLIASHYRRLALLLNPNENKFVFAEQAFKLVSKAWLVLSNPSRKFQVDNEFGSNNHMHFNFNFANHSNSLPNQNFTNNNVLHFNFMHNDHTHGGGLSVAAAADHQYQYQRPQQFLSAFSQQQQLFTPPHSFNDVIHPNPFQQPVPWPQPQSQPQMLQQQQQEPLSFVVPQKSTPQLQSSVEQYLRQGEGGNGNVNVVQEGNDRVINVDGGGSDVNVEEALSFWTACPYCYNMYEYLRDYVDCALECQNCKRAFQAVSIAAPPETPEGTDAYFCCWGFYPVAVSAAHLEKNKKAASSWSLFSDYFPLSQEKNFLNSGKPKSVKKNWIIVDEDQDFVESSSTDDSSDDDWSRTGRKKRAKRSNVKSWVTKNVTQVRYDKVKRAKEGNHGNAQDVAVAQEGVDVSVPNEAVLNVPVVETSKKAGVTTIRKQPGRVAKDLGKLDLNVEFNNEGEEPAPGSSAGNKAGNRVEDNIEGIGFFEGLDEFLSSLPILNADGDDKAKAG